MNDMQITHYTNHYIDDVKITIEILLFKEFLSDWVRRKPIQTISDYKTYREYISRNFKRFLMVKMLYGDRTINNIKYGL